MGQKQEPDDCNGRYGSCCCFAISACNDRHSGTCLTTIDNPLQLNSKIVCRLPAFFRIFCQTHLHDAIECDRCHWVQCGDCGRIDVHDGRNHTGLTAPLE